MDRKRAKQLREELEDLTGDSDWGRVPLEAFDSWGYDAQVYLDQSVEPKHLLAVPPEVDVPRDFDRAVDGYRTFHTGPAWVSKGTRDPRQIGQFPGLVWPKKCCIVGKANHVMYSSDKWETKKHDYIHEHESGVVVALFDPELDLNDDVPKFVLESETVYLLGDCLGFEGETDDGEIIEAVGGKGDELYAIPSNRALIVINVSGKVARVEAMIWGGGLNVIDRGIVG